MKKIRKTLGLILASTLLLSLASCSSHNVKVDNPSEDIKTLVYIGSQDNRFYYYYDKDTKVMYVVYVGMNIGGVLTPLYNPDGTLKLYKESENK